MSAGKNLDDRTLEALIEMMYVAVQADGEFSDQERNAFGGQVLSLSDGRVTGERFRSLMKRIESDLASQGRRGRISALKDVFPDAAAREEALRLVVAMVAADGVVRTTEREVIVEVAEGLGIDNDVAADIVRELTRDTT